jgi:hypothetical protein
MIHASIDSLDEAVSVHRQGKGRSGGDASKWVGLLCPIEESYVYGKEAQCCVGSGNKAAKVCI